MNINMQEHRWKFSKLSKNIACEEQERPDSSSDANCQLWRLEVIHREEKDANC